MAGENTVEFTLEAKDLTTAALSRVSQQVDNLIKQNERLAQSGAAGATGIGRLETQLNRLTTVNGIAHDGLRRINSIIAGATFGAAFGFVAVAVSSLTETLIAQIVKWFDLETAATRAKASLEAIGRSMEKSVAPALIPIQTRLEEIKKQLANINARTPQAAAAIEARLIAERANLERLRNLILGPKPTEQEIGIGLNQEAIGKRI